MNREDVTRIALQQIELAKQGSDEEYRKIEFKSKWYNLKDEKEIMIFLKHSTAIVNSFGPDGYMIFGYDSGRGFTEAKFKDSNLRDESDLIDLINSRIYPMFHLTNYDIIIEGKPLSVLHIPPSIDKPHSIPKFKIWDNNGVAKDEPNRIFVRYGKSSRYATRTDIEYMYYDRKNITPEYKLILSFFHSDLRFHTQNCRITMTIENVGSRPVAIALIKFSLKPRNRDDDSKTLNIKIGGNLVVKANDVEIIDREAHYALESHESIDISLIQYLNKNIDLFDIQSAEVLNTRLEVIPSELTIL